MAKCVELEPHIEVLGPQCGQCDVVSVHPFVGLHGIVHARVDVYGRMPDADWDERLWGEWSARGRGWLSIGQVVVASKFDGRSWMHSMCSRCILQVGKVLTRRDGSGADGFKEEERI